MKRYSLLLLALCAFTACAQAELVLREDTASQIVLIGPFVDSTDGNTAETGLTISNTDVRLSVNGGNIVGKNSGACTHDELGYYACTFDATDTATVGRLQVMVHESGALPVYHEFSVVEEAVYDACCAASAAPLDSTAVQTAAAAALTAYDPPTNAEMTARTLASADYATATALATVDSNVDAILVDTGTTLPATLSTIAGYIDTEVASLLTGVNITSINGATITGDGAGTPFDVQ